MRVEHIIPRFGVGAVRDIGDADAAERRNAFPQPFERRADHGFLLRFIRAQQFDGERQLLRRRLDNRKIPVDPFRRQPDGGAGGRIDLLAQDLPGLPVQHAADESAGDQQEEQNGRIDLARKIPVAERLHGRPPDVSARFGQNCR